MSTAAKTVTKVRWRTARFVGAHFIGTALLVLAAVAIASLMLEGAVRVYVAKVAPNLFVFDPALGWIHNARTRRYPMSDGTSYLIDIDELGLRGRAHVAPSDRTRVLVLGDSFTEGFQVSDDEVFTGLWEHLRPDLAVFNSGVSGYSTLQEIMLAHRLEPVVRPDIVVMMVCGWNDLTDNIMPWEFALGPRPYVDASLRIHPPDWKAFSTLLLPVPGAGWLHRHSLAAYAIYKRLAPIVHGDGLSYHEEWRRRIPEADEWRVMESLLTGFAPGRRLVIVTVPSPDDVVSGDRTFSTRLGEIAARLGVPFIDLQPDLRPDDYLESDRHWNAAGHAVAARRLASVILPQPGGAVSERQELSNGRPATLGASPREGRGRQPGS